VPKFEIFDPFFFTSVNPKWVGDLRPGEFLIFFSKTTADICLLCFLRMLSVRQRIAYAGCAKKLPTQAECALKKTVETGNKFTHT
jgi:hypothetical protein